MRRELSWLCATALAACTWTAVAATYGDAAVIIQVDKDGELNITDAKGEPLQACDIEPDKGGTRCHGLDQNGEVLKMRGVGVMRTRGSSCIVVIDYVTGGARQLCW